MRMRNADTSTWVELGSHEVDELLSKPGRDLRWWSRAVITIGSGVMATTTMTLILFHVYQAMGETLTGAPGTRSAGVHVAGIIAMVIGAALIAAGVVLQLLPHRSRTQPLDVRSPAHVTNGHRSDHLVGMR